MAFWISAQSVPNENLKPLLAVVHQCFLSFLICIIYILNKATANQTNQTNSMQNVLPQARIKASQSIWRAPLTMTLPWLFRHDPHHLFLFFGRKWKVFRSDYVPPKCNEWIRAGGGKKKLLLLPFINVWRRQREKKVVETNFFVLFLASQKLVSESCKFALRSKKERLFQTKLCWVQMIVVLTGSWVMM